MSHTKQARPPQSLETILELAWRNIWNISRCDIDLRLKHKWYELVVELAAQPMLHDRLRPALLDAFSRVPRHHFVSDRHLSEAYDDISLPTLNGQTTSQPYVIFEMLYALSPTPSSNVLEIGTGTGYNATLVSLLVPQGHVYTIERDNELVGIARTNMKDLGVHNVTVTEGDGSLGYAKAAPFDRIIVTAKCPYNRGHSKVLSCLLEQLADGGLLVVPVHDTKFSQQKRKGLREFYEQLVSAHGTEDEFDREYYSDKMQEIVNGCRIAVITKENGTATVDFISNSVEHYIEHYRFVLLGGRNGYHISVLS